jgi:XTP/dITP diphosphohydrolase
LIAPKGLQAVSAADLNLPEPEETETTFVGNALIKARAAVMASNLPALADDSGLCVNALGGDPGVYSARWAGPEKSFSRAMEEIQKRLLASHNPDRSAHFICALALAWPDGATLTFEGRVDGHLTWPPRGSLGFGYDPMFIPAGYDQTFGEMDPGKKHSMSHRARAFAKFVEACLE